MLLLEPLNEVRKVKLKIMLKRQANWNLVTRDLNFNPTCSVPRYDGSLNLERFVPMSIGVSSLMITFKDFLCINAIMRMMPFTYRSLVGLVNLTN